VYSKLFKRKAIKTMNITTSFDVLQAVIFFQQLTLFAELLFFWSMP
jgi:hypothetical protein